MYKNIKYPMIHRYKYFYNNDTDIVSILHYVSIRIAKIQNIPRYKYFHSNDTTSILHYIDPSYELLPNISNDTNIKIQLSINFSKRYVQLPINFWHLQQRSIKYFNTTINFQIIIKTAIIPVQNIPWYTNMNIFYSNDATTNFRLPDTATILVYKNIKYSMI